MSVRGGRAGAINLIDLQHSSRPARTFYGCRSRSAAQDYAGALGKEGGGGHNRRGALTSFFFFFFRGICRIILGQTHRSKLPAGFSEPS